MKENYFQKFCNFFETDTYNNRNLLKQRKNETIKNNKAGNQQRNGFFR